MKGKALKRAVTKKDGYRAFDDVPLIQDTTELITPATAQKMLQKNKNNRPINWNKVEQYRKAMDKGEWKLHAQGIILDNKGNILTGQKRLYAVIYCGKPQYMRVSKGSPPDTSVYIDRGTPQSSRDLATRKTERKHSPTEVGILRAFYALSGKPKMSVDEISAGLVQYDKPLLSIIDQTKGLKKTKERMMVLGAILVGGRDHLIGELEVLGDLVAEKLKPLAVEDCWNKGAAFVLAMEKTESIVSEFCK